MAKQFDATTKQLIERHPADWLAYAGLPPPAGGAGGLSVVDSDVSTFSLAADKVIRVGAPDPYLAHVELQAGGDPELDRRVLVYNVLLRWRHGLPVRSVAVLLRPEALSPSNAGRVRDVSDPLAPLEFGYRLVRAWEQPVETVLAGGVGTLPLAPISSFGPVDLPEVYRRIAGRLDREAIPALADELWTATYILSGLRHPPDVVRQIMRGVRHMQESLTYQAIIAEGVAKGRVEGRAEGRAEEARSLLLRLGGRRFGPPPAGVSSTLEAIADVDRLEDLVERLGEVSDWKSLLVTPQNP